MEDAARPSQPDYTQNRRPGYITSNPVTVRPISMRWISDVPSKIVKILAARAVYAGQRSA
jgi:hypothetical protein